MNDPDRRLAQLSRRRGAGRHFLHCDESFKKHALQHGQAWAAQLLESYLQLLSAGIKFLLNHMSRARSAI